MATPASKNSTTPPFSRQKPNARSSELNDPLRRSSELNPMRRSFTGNPFGDKPSIIPHPRGFIPNTPVNSPSDFPPRRHSMGRERVSSFRDSEDKENGKDQNQKPGRIRSAAPSKGTKNFMSPTISAASKITVSPRKKVLSERNEPVRCSVSFADVRNLIVEDGEATTPVVTLKQNKNGDLGDGEKEPLRTDVDVVDGAGSLSRTFTDDKDFVNVDPSFKISPPGPPLAPLDADPSMRPYDPKTNYLSPRPQFLHYRPNPRIEHFRESGGIQLEDSFESETEGTEETESEDSQREEASSEMVKEEEDEEEEEEEEVDVSEPNPVKLDENEKASEAKTVAKKHFSGRKSLMTAVLLLAVAFFSFSATDSPSFASSPMFNSMDLPSIHIPFDEVRDSVKAYYDEYSQNVYYWSSNSLSYITKMISRLSGLQEFGPLPYANLSSLLADHQTSDGYLMFGHGVFDPVEKKEEVIIEALDEVIEENSNDEESEEEDYESLSEDQADDAVEAHENFEATLDEAVHQHIESEMIEADSLKEDIAFAADTEIKHENNIELEDQQGIERANDVQPEETTVAEGSSENPPEVELQATTENSEALSFWNTIKDSASKLPTHNLLSLALLLLCLLASVPLINRKKGQSSVQEATIQVQAPQPLLSKKLDHVAAASVSVDDHTSREQFSSRIWQTEVDMVHDYCPSEMSSYGKSASYSTKKGEEAQSQETKPEKQYRRESLASSDCSMGTSPSYGSFTTYEKIPRKKNGDEEIVTPVRRSSRIRKTETK